MLTRIPATVPLFVRSMGKLLRISHLATTEESAAKIREKNPDFVTVALAEDTARGTAVHVIAHAYEPDHSASLAKAIPDLVIRCVDELDTFVHCLQIDERLDPQRRGQLREIVPLVQDARTLCFPMARGHADTVAKVRHSYLTEECKDVVALARTLATADPADASVLPDLIAKAREISHHFPQDDA